MCVGKVGTALRAGMGEGRGRWNRRRGLLQKCDCRCSGGHLLSVFCMDDPNVSTSVYGNWLLCEVERRRPRHDEGRIYARIRPKPKAKSDAIVGGLMIFRG